MEDLLYLLPPFIDAEHRYFLHLQPTFNQLVWNAFYQCPCCGSIHNIYRAEGATPGDALMKLKSLLELSRFSLVPDPHGIEEVDEKKSV